MNQKNKISSGFMIFLMTHWQGNSFTDTGSVWKSNILKYEVVEAFQILQHFSNLGHNKTSIFFLLILFKIAEWVNCVCNIKYFH